MFLLRRFASRKPEEEPNGQLRLGETVEPLERIEELLEEGYFSQAYEEAERALASGKDKRRCLLVLGSAAYGLRKWELSVRHYEELLRASPSSKDGQDRLLAALSRLSEERTGNYDFARLDEAARRGETDVDAADYVGPIEVVDIPGKGKGIIATQDVKKGTLLLVSKAFAMVPTSLPESALATAIEERLARQPERIDDVAGLYYGRERDIATTTEESDWESVTDSTRLMLICKYNSFHDEPFIGAPESQTQQGIWILPSYFNHSCLKNAHRVFYGDVMTVFAVVDVKKGEELTFSYTPLMNSYERRKSHLVNYDVVCDCRLCQLDRMDPCCAGREELTKDLIEKLIKRPQTAQEAIPIFTRIVDQIRETYANRSDARTRLYWPLKILAGSHQAMGEYAEAVQYLLEAVKCLPESAMITYGLWVYVQIAVCCARMRRPRTAHRYARMTADLHRIRCAHDDELFKKIHPYIAHLL